MSAGNDKVSFLKPWMLAVASPVICASYFCYVRAWSRSVRDQVPFIRIDLNEIYPIMLGLLFVGALAAIVFASPLRRTASAQFSYLVPSRIFGIFVRLAAAAGISLLLSGFVGLFVNDDASSEFIIYDLIGCFVIAAVLCRIQIATAFRAWLAGKSFARGLFRNAITASVLRPYRGRGRLVDSNRADVFVQAWKPVVAFAVICSATGIAMTFGAGDAASQIYETTITERGPEVVLRQYGDDIVTAPINLRTLDVTLAFTERRLGGAKPITLMPIRFARRLNHFVPDATLANAVASANRIAAR